MTIDATFWVAISFFIFLGILIYFKIPNKIKDVLNENISNIKNQISEAEKLKEEAKNILSEYEGKVSRSKEEIKNMILKAKKDSEKMIIKTNDDFHKIIENRKKTSEEKIKQMKIKAVRDIKNQSVEVAIKSVKKIIKNSIDKKKLDKIYISSIEETKKILKNKSI